jgi:hypothetical protein
MYEERRQGEDMYPHGGAKEKRKYVVVVQCSVKHQRTARRKARSAPVGLAPAEGLTSFRIFANSYNQTPFSLGLDFKYVTT